MSFSWYENRDLRGAGPKTTTLMLACDAEECFLYSRTYTLKSGEDPEEAARQAGWVLLPDGHAFCPRHGRELVG